MYILSKRQFPITIQSHAFKASSNCRMKIFTQLRKVTFPFVSPVPSLIDSSSKVYPMNRFIFQRQLFGTNEQKKLHISVVIVTAVSSVSERVPSLVIIAGESKSVRPVTTSSEFVGIVFRSIE